MEHTNEMVKIAEQRLAMMALVRHLMTVDPDVISIQDFRRITVDYILVLLKTGVVVGDYAEVDLVSTVSTFVDQEMAVEQAKQAATANETLN